MEQLTVYILERHIPHEFDEILGCFGSFELAEKELRSRSNLSRPLTPDETDGSYSSYQETPKEYWTITPYKVQSS